MASGWKPVPAPPPQSKVDDRSRQAAGDPRRPVDGGQRRRHRRARAHRRATTSSGKTGTAQVISNAGGKRAPAKTTRTCATTAGSCSSRRATTRRLPASSSPSTACHGGQRRADRATHARDVLREEGRAAAAAAAAQARGLRLRGRRDRHPDARPRSPAASDFALREPECSSDACSFTSTGRCWPPILVITGIGVAMIYSTTYVHLPRAGAPGAAVLTQIYAIGLGLIAMLVCLAIDYRKLAENSLILYVASDRASHLRAVLGLDQFMRTRWIDVGPFNLQPSEFARVTVALMLAMFFGENRAARATQATSRWPRPFRRSVLLSPGSRISAPPSR